MFGDVTFWLAVLIFACARSAELEVEKAERLEEEYVLRRYVAWKRAQREGRPFQGDTLS